MVHPEYKAFPTKPERAGAEADPDLPDDRRAHAGLGSPASSRRRLGSLGRMVAARSDALGCPKPPPTFGRVLRFLHNPPGGATVEQLADARTRVALDELISNIIVLKRRQRERAHERTIALPRAQQLGRVLLASGLDSS